MPGAHNDISKISISFFFHRIFDKAIVYFLAWKSGFYNNHPRKCIKRYENVRNRSLQHNTLVVVIIRWGFTLPVISIPISSRTWLTTASDSSSSPDSPRISSSVSLTIKRNINTCTVKYITVLNHQCKLIINHKQTF